jgi:hypothetical protein
VRGSHQRSSMKTVQVAGGRLNSPNRQQWPVPQGERILLWSATEDQHMRVEHHYLVRVTMSHRSLQRQTRLVKLWDQHMRVEHHYLVRVTMSHRSLQRQTRLVKLWNQ